MKKEYFISAFLIPIFYVIVGIIFIFFPELPQTDISPNNLDNKLALLFTQEVGALFVIIALLVWQIHNKSKELYSALNGTMIVVMILLSLIEPYFYSYTKAPELLVILLINLFFIFLLLYERRPRKL
ncbi:MAG: hypothetical protein H8E84_03985 [Flavobacteriales bacterium]|nr:hypothetical protein [Flavobacteriales bacterium]